MSALAQEGAAPKLYALDDLFTVADVMEATGMGRTGIQHHINRGTLRTVRIGRDHVIVREEYERFRALNHRPDVGVKRTKRPAPDADPEGTPAPAD